MRLYNNKRSCLGPERGFNFIFLQTKNESGAEAISTALDVLKDMQETPVPDQELDQIKNGIESSYVFNFNSTGKLVSRAAVKKLLGYPEDYDERYFAQIAHVSADDVKGVANRHWNLSELAIVVVGNEKVREQLERLLETPPAYLSGYKLEKVKFDQVLRYRG